MRTGVLAVGGWLVAAALTVGVSWSAVSVVQKSVVARADVSTALPTPEETATATATATAVPTRSTRPPSPTTPAARAVAESGVGGSVTVRCVGGVPTFLSVVPKQGYTSERDDSSPEVKFTSSTHRTELTASCAGTTARISLEEKNTGGDDGGGDDGGGDDGGGDDGGGGGSDDSGSGSGGGDSGGRGGGGNDD